MRSILVVFYSFISLTLQEDPEFNGIESGEVIIINPPTGFSSNRIQTEHDPTFRSKTNKDKESIVRIKRGGSISLIFKIDQKGLQDGTSIKSCKVKYG